MTTSSEDVTTISERGGPPLVMDYYDREGRRIDLHRLSELLGDPDYKRIAQTSVGPYDVSTVWLGVDHGFVSAQLKLGREVAPLIFETMVFGVGGRDLPLADEQWRYSTEAQARQGHVFVVRLIEAEVALAPRKRGTDDAST